MQKKFKSIEAREKLSIMKEYILHMLLTPRQMEKS